VPRKPFKPFADRKPGGLIEIGTRAFPLRPEHFAVVGQCLAAWPHVEAEMALMLGQLLGASNAATLAVFQALRRSSMQREAMLGAANVVLTETDLELIKAILNVHGSIEKERNALAHGHLGVYSELEDGILSLSATNYVALKAELVLKGDRTYDQAKRDRLNLALSYYTKSDLNLILADIDKLGWIWSDAIRYFQERAPETRDARYRKLSNEPRIATEIKKLRNKLRLKQHLARSEELLCQVQEVLAPDRRSLVICVDGADGVGKSSLASWLAWQLGAASIHLDLYVVLDSCPLQWRTEDLQRAIDARLRVGPVVVEGILALNALEGLNRFPDFLIVIEGNGSSDRLGSEIAAYNAHQRPLERANFTVQGIAEDSAK
jgi:hypothetical protein